MPWAFVLSDEEPAAKRTCRGCPFKIVLLMLNVTIEDLRKVTYLDIREQDHRTVNLMPLWDGTQWHMWFPTPSGLVEGKIVDTTEPVAQSFVSQKLCGFSAISKSRTAEFEVHKLSATCWSA